jgi:hypothetical protein
MDTTVIAAPYFFAKSNAWPNARTACLELSNGTMMCLIKVFAMLQCSKSLHTIWA